MESDTDVSVSSTKRSGWSALLISLHGLKKVTKDRSNLRGIPMVDSGNTIKLFVNTNMIKNRKKSDIPINFLRNAGQKVVDAVGEIPGAGQTKFHP